MDLICMQNIPIYTEVLEHEEKKRLLEKDKPKTASTEDDGKEEGELVLEGKKIGKKKVVQLF